MEFEHGKSRLKHLERSGYFKTRHDLRQPGMRGLRFQVVNDMLHQPPSNEFHWLGASNNPGHSEKNAALLLKRFDEHVLFEDSDLLVLNKPPGVATHYSPRTAIGVAEIAREVRGMEVQPAHRLDTNTSGVLVFTKSYDALLGMCAQFRDKEQSDMEKRYVAIVDGVFDSPETLDVQVNLRVGYGTMGKKTSVVRDLETGKDVLPSRTLFTPKYEFETQTDPAHSRTLVDVRIMTGRTHQIRVVSSEALGKPIIGDRLYGTSDEVMKETRRPMLHSRKLIFQHPTTAELTTIDAAWPNDFQEVLDRMKLVKIHE